MKLRSLFPAVLLAALAALSASAVAADAEKTSTGKVKPHSHLQDKTGIAPKPKAPDAASSEKSAKSTAEQRKSKHIHSRDSK